MERLTFFDQVRKHFRYLVDEYEFSVVSEETYPHFDNVAVVLLSENCRIRVSMDRSEVYISVAPLSPFKEYWLDLGTIIEYLTQGGDNSWDFEIPHYDDYDARIEWQVAKLADILRPYCDRICGLFRKEVHEQEMEKLIEFQERRFSKR